MEDHISAVFSSAVGTSLSEQKGKKKKSQKPKAPPPPPPGASNENKAPPSETCLSVGNDWVTVVSKSSKHQSAATINHQDVPTTKKSTLANNKFYLPPAAASTNVNKKECLTEAEIKQKKKSLRTFRKNQRRAARRRAAAAQKDSAQAVQASKDTEDEVETCTPPTEGNNDGSVQQKVSPLLTLPYAVLTEGILSFLRPEEMAVLGACSKYARTVTEEGFLWQSMFRQRFPKSQLTPSSMKEWKRAYQISLSKVVDRLRCFSTHKTFLEDVIGVGVNYTINPRTKTVDYIELSQDLLSVTAFGRNHIRADVFGNPFKLFLPLYFSEEHFQRALPYIQKTIVRLCSLSDDAKGRCWFEPLMVLDVFPKLINTFVVLLSDEGIAACRKSFDGLIRVHRLFLALAHEYPEIKRAALLRLRKFVLDEKYRSKSVCPNLGWILPLLMIVDENFGWRDVCAKYVSETFDRSVLWSCKKYPELERTHDATGRPESSEKADQRVELTRDAMTVNLRLIMFHAYFYRATSCLGKTTQERANVYDRFFGQPDPEEEQSAALVNDEDVSLSESSDAPALPSTGAGGSSGAPPTLSFLHFRDQINCILSTVTWRSFFLFVGLKCPPTKADMAHRLRQHVINSKQKGYHKKGMDFSRVQASGTSAILSKGQQYSANAGLRRVVFRDFWTFNGDTKYLDATCILYKGKKRFRTIDYRHTGTDDGAVQHSGDEMREDGGTHTIHLNLEALDPAVTSCVFVISAWAEATLADIVSSSISFSDADADEAEAPLCTYDLEAHDKISYLTSVIMCRLYRTTVGGQERWHVQAIGDAHKGAADNYGPIYAAVEKLL